MNKTRWNTGDTFKWVDGRRITVKAVYQVEDETWYAFHELVNDWSEGQLKELGL